MTYCSGRVDTHCSLWNSHGNRTCVLYPRYRVTHRGFHNIIWLKAIMQWFEFFSPTTWNTDETTYVFWEKIFIFFLFVRYLSFLVFSDVNSAFPFQYYTFWRLIFRTVHAIIKIENWKSTKKSILFHGGTNIDMYCIEVTIWENKKRYLRK